MAQLDLTELFIRNDEKRDARRKLLNDLAERGTDWRVIALLVALDDLGEEVNSKRVLHNGTVRLSVKIHSITRKLGLHSDNTTRTYIKLAKQTPFLAVDDTKTYRSHTYLIRWLAIVDAPCGEMNAGGVPVSIDRQGGSLRTRVEALKSPSIEALKSPSIEALNEPLLKTGFKPVSYECGSKYKKPVSKPVCVEALKSPSIEALNSVRTPAFQPGAWRRWKDAVEGSNLADPLDVEQLYAIAVAENFFPASDANRFRVFVQAAQDRLVARVPKKLFIENVAHARWFANCEAEDLASQMMAQLELLPDEPIEQLDPEDAAQANLERQKAALAQYAAARERTPVS
jgi:hypothetical protein